MRNRANQLYSSYSQGREGGREVVGWWISCNCRDRFYDNFTDNRITKTRHRSRSKQPTMMLENPEIKCLQIISIVLRSLNQYLIHFFCFCFYLNYSEVLRKKPTVEKIYFLKLDLFLLLLILSLQCLQCRYYYV